MHRQTATLSLFLQYCKKNTLTQSPFIARTALSSWYIELFTSALIDFSSLLGFLYLIPSLSLPPASVWGPGVDSELACTQAYYARFCTCTVLEQTREARAGLLHHRHQDWLGSGWGSVRARERLAWPGPYAFNTGTDVEHGLWTPTPLASIFCPTRCLEPDSIIVTCLLGHYWQRFSDITAYWYYNILALGSCLFLDVKEATWSTMTK